MSELVVDWHARGLLRPELTRARAIDIVWSFTGPDVYRLLVRERRWAKVQYREWIQAMLEREVFA